MPSLAAPFGIEKVVCQRARVALGETERADPLLGRVPLDPVLRECGDAGEPLLVAGPDSESGRALDRIAEAVLSLDRGTIVKPLTLVSS